MRHQPKGHTTAKKHKKQDSATGPAPFVGDADAPKRYIGTELPTEDYDAVERYTDYIDEWVDAAVPALEGLREFYLQMEARPAFNVFAVAVAAQLLTWTADALTEDDDLLLLV